MKTRYLLYPPVMGLVAAALILIAIKAAGTSADWLPANLFLPGRLLTAALFPHTTDAPINPLQYFVEFALNFATTWIGLMFTVYFIDKMVVTLHELTKY
jgi:hypothetical protein